MAGAPPNAVRGEPTQLNFMERLLLFLSKPTNSIDAAAHPTYEAGDELVLLRREFPDFDSRVTGRSVLEYGCGAGYQAVAIGRIGAHRVVGVDPHEGARTQAAARAASAHLSDRVSFVPAVSPAHHGRFDVVVSQNAMEHFDDPAASLTEMHACLRPGGTALITFGPPWFAPYGSHMHFFTQVPWVNLLFPESVVLRVRAFYRQDGATRYEQVEQGLNRMTVRRFETLVAETGFAFERRRYTAVRNLRPLIAVPAIRELFVNQVTAALRRPA
jgi:SAM-dependent methyltransferase